MITQEELNDLKDVIVNKVHPEKILIFGSYAQGNPNEDSDLDILIIQNTELPRLQRSRMIRPHLRKFCFPMDILVYTPQEVEKWKNVPAAFITNIMSSARVIYG